MTTVSMGKRLLVGPLAFAFFCMVGSKGLIAKEEIDFKRVVTIHDVKPHDGVVTKKGKKKQKKGTKNARRKTLEITFSVDPDVPKGAILLFELEYHALAFGKPKKYKLASDNPNNLKLFWSPKFRIPVDTYYLWTKMPMELQSQKVQKALKKKSKRFPLNSAPWPAYYQDLPIEVGTAADAKAEKQEIKKYFRDACDMLIRLNGEFVDLCDEVDNGDKHVEGKNLDVEAFSKDIHAWMEETAKVQRTVFLFPQKEPGLYKKAEGAHVHLGILSRMVAKRCFRVRLDETLGKYSLNRGSLEVPAVKGFNPNQTGSVRPRAMKKMYDRVAGLSGFAEDLAAEEEQEETGAGDAEE